MFSGISSIEGQFPDRARSRNCVSLVKDVEVTGEVIFQLSLNYRTIYRDLHDVANVGFTIRSLNCMYA